MAKKTSWKANIMTKSRVRGVGWGRGGGLFAGEAGEKIFRFAAHGTTAILDFQSRPVNSSMVELISK